MPTSSARRVTEIVGGLADTPDDPARRPDLDDYQARAAEATPPDASPEVQAQVSRMARIEQARADRAWQAARGRAATSALDWLGTNPAAPLMAMPAELRDGLSPEQTDRLDQVALNGGRVVTDRDLYDRLDDQAINEPEEFAGLDLAQHRLSLGDSDYNRLTKLQQALAEGKSDPAFERHRLGRLFLGEGLRAANLVPDGEEARTARQQLDRLLGAFEIVEGKPPTMADIRGLVDDVLPRENGDPNIVRTSGGEPVEANGNTQIAPSQETAGDDENVQIAQQQEAQNRPPVGKQQINKQPEKTGEQITQESEQRREKTLEPARAPRGIAPPTEPDPGSPEFRAAHLAAVGEIVRLPNGTAIPDPNSPTGYVMSPDIDLAKVAADGRRIGENYAYMLLNPYPNLDSEAYSTLGISLNMLVGHGGTYDYQRRGSFMTGFTQLRHFRNIANINVGLIGQQAGLTLDEILKISGEFAKSRSRNSDPADEYGLSAQTRRYIEEGYKIGSSGVFGPAASLPSKR